jgi:para-aminobenzoate synthetase component 1
MSREPMLWLDSQDASHPEARASWHARHADVILRYAQGVATVDAGGERHVWNCDGFTALARARLTWPGWWGGYLGYDLKNDVEDLRSENPDPVGAPDLVFMRWTDVSPFAAGGSLPFEVGRAVVSAPEPMITKEAYEAAIRTAKRHIEEGDIYEINLSHPMVAGVEGDARAVYAAMRDVGPVPFAAYMEWDGAGVCCASPERFVSKEGRALRSDPIKGTTGRGATPEHDETLRGELLASEKNRAENLMIVDLVRHDFSRVCVPGSVKVDRLFDIQTFRTVHQMVSTVTGLLQDDISVEDVLAACFPMGSMTGAPKIRAMQLIEELETWRRGIYSGAIGYITETGDFSFNVVIRSAVIRNGTLTYGVGGAITSDSDPEAEWEETLIKARALVHAIPHLKV